MSTAVPTSAIGNIQTEANRNGSTDSPSAMQSLAFASTAENVAAGSGQSVLAQTDTDTGLSDADDSAVRPTQANRNEASILEDVEEDTTDEWDDVLTALSDDAAHSAAASELVDELFADLDGALSVG